MRSFSAAVSIRASREQIWAILTDASAYPEWNSAVERLEGGIVPGGRVTVHSKQVGQLAVSFQVERFDAPKKMVWVDRRPLNTIVKTRTFLLRALKDGVEFEMREVYSGWAARWYKRLLPDLQSTFEHFAVALKRRAEQNAAPQPGAEAVQNVTVS